jgi:hypothetical protein
MLCVASRTWARPVAKPNISLTPVNLLTNPNFDTSISGWKAIVDNSSNAGFTPMGAGALSGAAFVSASGTAFVNRIYQWVNLPSDSRSLDLFLTFKSSVPRTTDSR